MSVPMDTSKMTEQELQFHYFKMHDADNNNKLDGCELIKSLIHWHGKFLLFMLPAFTFNISIFTKGKKIKFSGIHEISYIGLYKRIRINCQNSIVSLQKNDGAW